MFLIVPALVAGIYLVLDQSDEASQAEPLIWADRATWPRNQFTVFKSLERGQMSSARTNRTHFAKLGLQVSPEEYLAVQRAAELAQLPREAFSTEATRDQLQALLADHAGLFYVHYLLGQWHQLRGDAAAADAAWSEAFRLAPAALLRHHVDAAGRSARGVSVPAVELIVDRIIDDHRDPTLVLIYPFLQSDDQGFVFLPVYKAILRHAEPPPLPGLPDSTEKPDWFSFFGQVGRLPDLTLK